MTIGLSRIESDLQHGHWYSKSIGLKSIQSQTKSKSIFH